MNFMVVPFDGANIELTVELARFLSFRKGNRWLKEIVSADGEYAQCVACVDNGRMLLVERDGFDRQQPIVSDDYHNWRVVGETLDDSIPAKFRQPVLF